MTQTRRPRSAETPKTPQTETRRAAAAAARRRTIDALAADMDREGVMCTLCSHCRAFC